MDIVLYLWESECSVEPAADTAAEISSSPQGMEAIEEQVVSA